MSWFGSGVMMAPRYQNFLMKGMPFEPLSKSIWWVLHFLVLLLTRGGEYMASVFDFELMHVFNLGVSFLYHLVLFLFHCAFQGRTWQNH